jgi:hypothetical protein
MIMKYLKNATLLLVGFAFLVSCSDSLTDSDETATGQIRMLTFDAPLQMNADHIYLDIEEVSVHQTEEDTEEGWTVIATPDSIFDYLELVNGVKAVLADTALEVGHYTQMRLLLGQENSIVVDGVEHSLLIPSGVQTGVKLNLDFDVNDDEIIEIYVDFNAAKSISHTPDQGYIMRPTFRAFKRVTSGTISGAVSDITSHPIAIASVHAISGEDTTTTLTDTLGTYMLIVPTGT